MPRRKYIFRAVSVLTGQVLFVGKQADFNRFLARVRDKSVGLPIVAEELHVQKVPKPKLRSVRPEAAPVGYDEVGTVYASWIPPDKRV